MTIGASLLLGGMLLWQPGEAGVLARRQEVPGDLLEWRQARSFERIRRQTDPG